MKVTEQYFPVVLYTIQTFGSPLNETSMYYYYGDVTFFQDKICDFLNFSLGTLNSVIVYSVPRTAAVERLHYSY